MHQWPPQDPADFLQNTIDYSLWLEEGETISASSWTVVTGTVGITNTQLEDNAVRTSVWVTGGVTDTVAQLANTIQTTDGRTHKTTVDLPIEAN